MPVSFSAEYLYQGAKVLSSPMPSMGEDNAFECPEALFALARAVYSLGIFVIAPLGMLYHGCASGIYYGRSRLAEERDVAPLNQLMEAHWEAAGYDGQAFLTSCTGLCVTAGVALGVIFGISDPDMLYLILICIAYPIVGVIYGEPAGNFFLQYGYAEQATYFLNLLPREQRQIYGAYHVYNKVVRSGQAIDAPLSAQEIAEICNIAINNVRMGGSPIESSISLCRFLLQSDKVSPTYRARMEGFVGRADDLRRLWEQVVQEAQRFPEEEQRGHIAQNMAERMQPIMAALPPIGAPAEAAHEAAASNA